MLADMRNSCPSTKNGLDRLARTFWATAIASFGAVKFFDHDDELVSSETSDGCRSLRRHSATAWRCPEAGGPGAVPEESFTTLKRSISMNITAMPRL